MSEPMREATEQAPADASPELVHPKKLLSGRPHPMRDHTFRTPDGARQKVKLQGLSYAEKSEIDARSLVERTENERKGITQPDLRAPRIIARAVRTPEGKRPFDREEDEVVFAISIAEQLGDGEINRAYNAIMELSGYGKDALAEAGKD